MNYARVILSDMNFKSATFTSTIIREIFMMLPRDVVLQGVSMDLSRGCSYLIVESNSFIDTAANNFNYPDIIPSFSYYPNGDKYLDCLDMTQALASYQTPQGPPTTCTRAGCTFNNPCFMCTANASSTSLPIYATPSPWGKSVAQTHGGGSYTIPISGPMSVGSKISINGSCAHKWKSYQGLNEMFDYCETCNVKRA